MMPLVTFNALMSQYRYLLWLKKRSTLIAYPACPTSGSLSVSVLVFSDASRCLDDGQFSFFADLLLGPFEEDSLLYTLSWTSHKSKCPVKSISAAEILAASESIDEGKYIKRAVSLLLSFDVRF